MISDLPTGRSLAIASRLAEVEALTARGAWSDARALLERDGDSLAEHAELCALYGETLLRLGLPQLSLDWLEPHTRTMAQRANRRAWIRMLNLTGAAAFELGRIDVAEQYFASARQHATADGDFLTSARALNNLALVASTRGDRSRAMQYYALAVPTYERAASVRGVAECCHNIAVTLIESGNLDEAEEWDRRAMAFAREMGNDRLLAYALGGRAEVRLLKEDYDLARVLASRAADAFRALQDVASEAHALRLYGQALHGQQAYTPALETLSSAIALAQDSAVRRIVGECRLARARCLIDLGDKAAAHADLVAALEDFAALGASDKQQQVRRLLRALSVDTHSR